MIRLDVERGIGERPIVVARPDAEPSDDFGEIAVVGDGNYRGQERLISHNRCRKTQKYVLAPVHRQSVTPAAGQGEQAGEPPGKAGYITREEMTANSEQVMREVWIQFAAVDGG